MNPAQTRNVTFADAVAALGRAGFVWDTGSGSHQVYRRPDGQRVLIPRHGNEIKPAYVRQIRGLLNKHTLASKLRRGSRFTQMESGKILHAIGHI